MACGALVASESSIVGESKLHDPGGVITWSWGRRKVVRKSVRR